jgi:hypothetical protein
MALMRPLHAMCALVSALVLASASAALAQDKDSSSAPPDRGAGQGDKADSGGGSKSDGKDAAADKKDEKHGAIGGYSWSDKPAAAAHQPRRHHKRIKIDPNAPIAMYPGFRMLADGSSQVWVYVSRKVNVTAGGSAAQPTFVLNGAQVAIRNNTNALITEYFDTPLARAQLKRDAAGAQLVLTLREPASVKHRIVDGPGGTTILYVDLPKAQKSYTLDDFDSRTSGSKKVSAKGATLPQKSSSSKSGPKQ